MKKYIENIIKNVLREHLEMIAISVEKRVVYSMFSCIGLDRIRKIIDEAEKYDIKYMSLADIYTAHIKDNNEVQNSDILHTYFELLPKLNEFSKAFNPKIESEIEKRIDNLGNSKKYK